MSRVNATGLPLRGPLLLLAVVLTLYLAKAVLIPVAFALTLMFLLAPAVGRLEKWGLSRAVALGVVAILTCAGLGVGGYVLSRQVIDIARALPGYQANVQLKMNRLRSPERATMERAVGALEEMGDALSGGSVAAEGAAPRSEPMPVRVVDAGRGTLKQTAELLMTFLQPIGQVGVVLVFTIYMLMKREELRNRLLLLAGMGHINMMSRALEDATLRISRYFLIQMEVNAGYGIAFGTGLFLIGAPHALLWGVLAAVLRVVPYVGTLVALICPLLVSVAVSTTWWPPLLVLALFLLLEITAANFVEPWLFSSRTGISSLALLAMAIFWIMLWGWPGLVLSTPLTVCMVVLGRYVPQMEFLQILLGTNADLSPPAAYYERLLAMDERQARQIAEGFVEGKPLVELYDAVVIPALGLAEEDRHKGALDEVRANFVFLSVGELLARLSGYRERGAAVTAKSEISLRMDAWKGSSLNDFAVVCISGGDPADELTTLMLTQVMERAGHPTVLLLPDAVSDEILAGLAQEPTTVIFISALPPFAFAQVQSMFQRVRPHLSGNRVVIGLWEQEGEADDVARSFGADPPDAIVRSLAEALERLETWRLARHAS